MTEKPNWGELDIGPVDSAPASIAEETVPVAPSQTRAAELSRTSGSPGIFDGAAGVLDDDPLLEGQAPLELAIEPETIREMTASAPSGFRSGKQPDRPASVIPKGPYPEPRDGWQGDIRYFFSVIRIRHSLKGEVQFRAKRSTDGEQRFHEALVRLGRKVVSTGWEADVNDELRGRVQSALRASQDSLETGKQAAASEADELEAFREKIDAQRREAEQITLREAPLLAQTEVDEQALKRAKLTLQRAEIELRNLPQSDDPQDPASELLSRIQALRTKRDDAERTLEASRQALGECRRLHAVATGHAESLSEQLTQLTMENQRMHVAREDAQKKADHELNTALADVGYEALNGSPLPSLRDECTSAKAAQARWDEASAAHGSHVDLLTSYDEDTFRRGGLLTAGIVSCAVALPLLVLVL